MLGREQNVLDVHGEDTSSKPTRETVSRKNSEMYVQKMSGSRDSATQVEETRLQDEDEKPVRLVNVIFLPFMSWWRAAILFEVFLRCITGPLVSVYPILHCPDKEVDSFLEYLIKYSYTIGEPLYFVDTFLYILHRQVAEEAMKREFLPKSAGLIMLDILSVLPLKRILTDDPCSTKTPMYPNVLGFFKLFVIYRIGHYFSLKKTHSYKMLVMGCALMFIVIINAFACFFFLCMANGLGWTYHVQTFQKTYAQQIKTSGPVGLHFIAINYILTFLLRVVFEKLLYKTNGEFTMQLMLMELGFLVTILIFVPKLFNELKFRQSPIFNFQPRAFRVLDAIKKRSPEHYDGIKNFYDITWKKQHGITSLPNIIHLVPRSLRLDIRYDLAWAVFYHSPTLRGTSLVFRRWLSEFVELNCILPGEKFFAEAHCLSKLYYVKTGILQLLSADDSIAPIVSVSSGTIFGDIGFHTPPIGRKVYARCLNYCEVFSISRAHILHALNKFPADKRLVMRRVRLRLEHAHQLNAIKNDMKSQIKTEEEGIVWLKRRWWEISDVILSHKGMAERSFKIPPDETAYHCAKFIGQVVFCDKELLQKKSLFYKVIFPWILAPKSHFTKVWHVIVRITIFLVLILFPPCLARDYIEHVQWFSGFATTVDFIFIFDIIVTVITAKDERDYMRTNILVKLFDRFKEGRFILDILSTPCIDYVFTLPLLKNYAILGKFNRIVKTYVLFLAIYNKDWWRNQLIDVYFRICLLLCWTFYVFPYFMFVFCQSSSFLTTYYIFRGCLSNDTGNCEIAKTTGIQLIVTDWITTSTIYCPELFIDAKHTLIDTLSYCLVLVLYTVLFLLLKQQHVVTLLFKHSSTVNYQYYVCRIWNYHMIWNMSPALSKRLNAYLDVHYRYNKGIDFLYPDLAKNETYAVRWKFHGQVAEKIIGESAVFKGADPVLIKELAEKAKFIILPKNSSILAYGVYSDSINWLLHGAVKVEQDVNYKIVTSYMKQGELMSICTFFYNQATLKRYSSETDTEIIFLKRSEFLSIIKRYPAEWSIFRLCLNELAPQFHKMYREILKMRNLPKTDDGGSNENLDESKEEEKKSWFSKFLKKNKEMFEEYRKNPESRLIGCWLVFRAGVIVVNLVAVAVQGGMLITIYYPLNCLRVICWLFAVADMIVKMFIPYYDKRGLIISDKKRCAVRYLTRGFIVDALSFIGRCPTVILGLVGDDNKHFIDFLITFFNALPVYLLYGYFSYKADVHRIRVLYLELFKWQIIIFMVMITAAYFYIKNCFQPTFDEDWKVSALNYKNDTCWMPTYFALDENATLYHFQLTFAQSLSLVQSAFFNNFIGLNFFSVDTTREAITYLCLSAFFCYQYTRCQVYLLLHYFGNSCDFSEFKRWLLFLKYERIEQSVIDKVIVDFNYKLTRTYSVDIALFMGQASIVFRQDRNYFFFKRTLKAANSVLNGGDPLIRQLSGVLSNVYFLPEYDIVRQNQLTTAIYIIHRGKALVIQDDKEIATLSKGCLFGQLQSSVPKAMRITVKCVTHCDVLTVPCASFQQMIGRTVSKTIESIETVKNDYIFLDVSSRENPYNTLEYLIRAKKSIKLPRMPVKNEDDKWFKRWLIWSWVINPVLTCTLVLPMAIVRNPSIPASILKTAVFFLDIIHFIYVVSEFFSVHLVCVFTKFVYKYVGWKKFKDWSLYFHIFTIIFPAITIFFLPLEFQLIRLLRIHLVFSYYKLYDRVIDNPPRLFKLLYFLLLVHTLTVGWQYVACKFKIHYDKFPVKILVKHKISPNISHIISSVGSRKEGCVCVYPKSRVVPGYRTMTKSFFIQTQWEWDYFKAFQFIVAHQTHMNINYMLPFTIKEIYYKIFACHILYLLELWISSIAIRNAYIKLRELYEYDYQVAELVKHLRTNGVCDYLLQSIKKYATLLWNRQSGTHESVIVDKLNICLREDVYEALYMYHLESVKLFSDMPVYFLRQMVVHFKRITVLPGKYIVQEGDVHPCIYFIHDGEVEKWYTDSHGETRMGSVLGTSGYFGLLPGLFPMMPFTYSYYSRTIVDLVYLHFREWQYLLKSYPDIKSKLYKQANAMRKHKYTG